MSKIDTFLNNVKISNLFIFLSYLLLLIISFFCYTDNYWDGINYVAISKSIMTLGKFPSFDGFSYSSLDILSKAVAKFSDYPNHLYQLILGCVSVLTGEFSLLNGLLVSAISGLILIFTLKK